MACANTPRSLTTTNLSRRLAMAMATILPAAPSRYSRPLPRSAAGTDLHPSRFTASTSTAF